MVKQEGTRSKISMFPELTYVTFPDQTLYGKGEGYIEEISVKNFLLFIPVGWFFTDLTESNWWHTGHEESGAWTQLSKAWETFT